MSAPTVTPERRAEFAAYAAEARAVRLSNSRVPAPSSSDGLHGARGARAGYPGTNEAPPVVARGTHGGREPSDLTADEVRELDMIALADERRRERLATRQADLSAIRDYANQFSRLVLTRERSLVASMGSNGSEVQHWEGPIGFEGVPTGDGRFIESGALTAAQFPLPLRWSPVDFGGHDGAIVVGRIDSAERRPDGTIFARGILDLGSQMGREAARLIGGGMLGGVSVDLDSTEMTTLPDTDSTRTTLVTSAARVRAATLVAIPAFENARIVLVDEPPQAFEYVGPHVEPDPDCGCGEPEPGVHTFPGIESFPTLDQMPTIDDLTTLAAHAARPRSTHDHHRH